MSERRAPVASGTRRALSVHPNHPASRTSRSNSPMRMTAPLRRVAALLVCLLGTFVATRALGAQAVGAGSVRGRAYTAGDRSPVAYALIRLSPVGGGGPVRTALTDQAGAFAFAGLTPGTYRLSLERIGYESETTEPAAPPEN